MLRDGRITDSKTIAGLLWVQAFGGWIRLRRGD